MIVMTVKTEAATKETPKYLEAWTPTFQLRQCLEVKSCTLASFVV